MVTVRDGLQLPIFIAVYWCARKCRRNSAILLELNGSVLLDKNVRIGFLRACVSVLSI